ncbi:bacillithiol biosynthesis cysteine-adding enzyme BshC [Lentibacillus cibarius]|uniref:Putative cysteine ligase BshC n=1 Tax=Lentibacillus cibarius TaxID=2583219 RepID=A0A5S3QNS9_9BACI|nr:bacillithiol biosynthesis cysteine-adding enzyme BshC [Lentibacillus cibarius]TMN23485.1 bacillithiol biosynthesis cysteine-adding enzyme BshC [Lentibacillus cibarius]
MRISPIKLQAQHTLINDYRNQKPDIMQYFDYDPYKEATYKKRLEILQEKDINREQLTEALTEMNEQWDAPESANRAIERLKDENSVVVIGGQQAGLLTGPLYTINKVISVIQFAKQQEAKLDVPVIPVFWIAGEDHDYEEINHVYLPEMNRMKKHTLPQQTSGKLPVSDIQIDGTKLLTWINHLFDQLPETDQTKALYQTILDCQEQSATYVDFFARFLYQLLGDEEIILADSGNPAMRNLEREYFVRMIEQQAQISNGVQTSVQQLKNQGYTVSLDVEPHDAHLFYHRHNERILLVRDNEGNWCGKQNEMILTHQEMLEIAENHPSHLSNNVVTRPVMQESLFPTLAFIGGPGEVSYWAALKPAFHAVGIEMPPVLPRLSFTFVDRGVEKILTKYGIEASHAINYGLDDVKTQWLAAQSDPPVRQVAEEVRQAIRRVHQPLREIASDIGADLGELADKNLYYLNGNIDFLEKRLLKTMDTKYAKEISEFDLAHHIFHPENGLQERIWNPLPLINDHGPCFIRQLASESLSFTEEHYIVYL